MAENRSEAADPRVSLDEEAPSTSRSGHQVIRVGHHEPEPDDPAQDRIESTIRGAGVRLALPDRRTEPTGD